MMLMLMLMLMLLGGDENRAEADAAPFSSAESIETTGRGAGTVTVTAASGATASSGAATGASEDWMPLAWTILVVVLVVSIAWYKKRYGNADTAAAAAVPVIPREELDLIRQRRLRLAETATPAVTTPTDTLPHMTIEDQEEDHPLDFGDKKKTARSPAQVARGGTSTTRNATSTITSTSTRTLPASRSVTVAAPTASATGGRATPIATDDDTATELDAVAMAMQQNYSPSSTTQSPFPSQQTPQNLTIPSALSSSPSSSRLVATNMEDSSNQHSESGTNTADDDHQDNQAVSAVSSAPGRRKDPPLVPKRPRTKLPAAQLASDILSSITHWHVIVTTTTVLTDSININNNKKNVYHPTRHNRHALTSETAARKIMISMNQNHENHGKDATLKDAIPLVAQIVPPTLREAVAWHARAHATLRNGYPPHILVHAGSANDDDYIDGFSQMMTALLQSLVQHVLDALKSDDCTTIAMLMNETNEKDEEEEDLFSDDYMQQDEPLQSTTSKQNMGPLHTFLALLEETPSTVSRPFLSSLFENELELAELVLFLTLHPQSSSKSSTSSFHAASIVVQSSPTIQDVWMKRMKFEATTKKDDETSWMDPLLKACAYCIPEAGAEQSTSTSTDSTRRTTTTTINTGNPFLDDLMNLQDFPICVYDNGKKNNNTSVSMLMQQTQLELQSLQSVAQLLLRKCGGKQVLFPWLSKQIQQHAAMTKILKSELLSSTLDHCCKSRRFLLGLAAVVTSMCSDSLLELFHQKGGDAFQHQYLRYSRRLFQQRTDGHEGEEERMLVIRDKSDHAARNHDDATKTLFTGGTEFFFLASALLRVSAYPAIRISRAFQQHYRRVFAAVQQAAADDAATLTPHSLQVAKPIVAVLLGWNTFFNNEPWMTVMTSFSILQLQWIWTQRKHQFQDIPEWMIKNPAIWLTRVAESSSTKPNLMKPFQADIVVQTATQLLQANQGRNDEDDAIMKSAASATMQNHNTNEGLLSPVVIDHLVKIIAAFVSSGVHRARNKQQQQRRRGRQQQQQYYTDNDTPTFDRDASMYSLSLDANDLGVVVFTNELVCQQLLPTLMQAFGAVNVVEGLDVDREDDGFDKFATKVRIAELFLRLWSHPNGKCRASILSQLQKDDDGTDGSVRLDGPKRQVAYFAKEIQVATGVLLDFSMNRMADVCAGAAAKHQDKDRTSMQAQHIHHDAAFLERQGQSACTELYYARLWIMLLCKVSQEPRIRKILGESSVSKDLASLLIHFVDILTDPDGGIHPNLDFAPGSRSADLLTSINDMTEEDLQTRASSITKARYLLRAGYGLDVSILCHQFLALLSGWHKQAKRRRDDDDDGGTTRAAQCSPILVAFATHDDYEENRYRNILQRLVVEAAVGEDCRDAELAGTEGRCANAIFHRDGYVDASIWQDQYKALLPKDENQLRTAKKDHMTREELQIIASIADIEEFLSDAETYRTEAMEKNKSTAMVLTPEKMEERVESILAAAGSGNSDTYAEKLSEWLVTSESFASKHTPGAFAHYYDDTARGRGTVCSGKIMVKEARRCHKNLPVPHPNSAAFCCFAEERMDLCRACITGPVDTPYALGIFVFEVFFPANYPNIPPLVTFMTTGGGQTRFNPNLYSDGKVCLSLLGTFNAQDESQKWNPSYSSLAQILLSIQTQLLVEEPYFNEPGNETRRGTPTGKKSANRYNLVLKLATLRHAIIAPLKEPPIGLEEICARHFSLCRSRIIVQAKRWMLEAKEMNSSIYRRFQRAYSELVGLLSGINSEMPSLSPCESDVKALNVLNAPVSVRKDTNNDESKMAAPAQASTRLVVHRRRVRRIVRVGGAAGGAASQEVTEMSVAAAFMTAATIFMDNPWANPSAATRRTGNATAFEASNVDPDDELYD